MTRISLLSGERTIVGDLLEPPPATSGGSGGGMRAGLLFVHGYASDRRGYVQRAGVVCDRLGSTCLAFDLGGHGESPGELLEFTRADHLQDVVVAYDRLASTRGVDPGRIGVCGASYGAYLSCLLLGQRAVRRLLLRAPALYIDRDAPDPTGERRHLGKVIDPGAALSNLERFDGPTLVLESERDEVVPRRSIDAYLAAARHGTHHVLADATHALVQRRWNAAFLDEILTWFEGL